MLRDEDEVCASSDTSEKSKPTAVSAHDLDDERARVGRSSGGDGVDRLADAVESSDGTNGQISACHVVAEELNDAYQTGHLLDGANKTDNVENLVVVGLLLGDAICHEFPFNQLQERYLPESKSSLTRPDQSLRSMSAPVRLPSPPQTARQSIPNWIKLLAAWRRPSRVRTSVSRRLQRRLTRRAARRPNQSSSLSEPTANVIPSDTDNVATLQGLSSLVCIIGNHDAIVLVVIKLSFTCTVLEEFSETKGERCLAERRRVVGACIERCLRCSCFLKLELLGWGKLGERYALGELGCGCWRRLCRVAADETFPTFADDVGLAATDLMSFLYHLSIALLTGQYSDGRQRGLKSARSEARNSPAAFIPAESPPLVRTAIFFCLVAPSSLVCCSKVLGIPSSSLVAAWGIGFSDDFSAAAAETEARASVDCWATCSGFD